MCMFVDGNTHKSTFDMCLCPDCSNYTHAHTHSIALWGEKIYHCKMQHLEDPLPFNTVCQILPILKSSIIWFFIIFRGKGSTTDCGLSLRVKGPLMIVD